MRTTTTKPNDFDFGLVPGLMLEEAAEKRRLSGGEKTLRYSTGDRIIDSYLGGGFGRGVPGNENSYGYELILIYARTGIGKSTFASQMVIDPASKGTPVLYLSLEDDKIDVVNRIRRQCRSEEEYQQVMAHTYFGKDNYKFTLETMAKAVDEWFDFADIIVIDHLQFVFERSINETNENEINRQRIFVEELNRIVKEKKKTLIIVSHVNKADGRFDKGAPLDLERVSGSYGIPGIVTKAVNLFKDNDGHLSMMLTKTRFGMTRFRPLPLLNTNQKIQCLYEARKDLYTDDDRDQFLKEMAGGTF